MRIATFGYQIEVDGVLTDISDIQNIFESRDEAVAKYTEAIVAELDAVEPTMIDAIKEASFIDTADGKLYHLKYSGNWAAYSLEIPKEAEKEST